MPVMDTHTPQPEPRNLPAPTSPAWPMNPQPSQQWIMPAPPPPPPPAGVPVYHFPPQQQPVMWQQPIRPRYVSGLTTGQHIAFGILTACTLGLAAPFWALAALLGRRRIG